jgi:hypothetical protein
MGVEQRFSVIAEIDSDRIGAIEFEQRRKAIFPERAFVSIE